MIAALNQTGDAILTDTNGSYAFEHVPSGTYSLSVNASNAFDHQHWESFGGDIIGSRAPGWVSLSW